MTDPSARPEIPTPPGEPPALLDAVRALLVPLAQLAVARGLSYASVDAMLRSAFVSAAHAAHPGLPEHRRVSRISAATGINRREVTRLTAAAERSTVRSRSYPNEVFAHWTTDPLYRDAKGHPLRLPRLGPAPSFESLAQTITRDMHPRSLLEELLRLGLALHDSADDSVALEREVFVPRGDRDRMDAFLGANVGDHLSAAVDNVLAEGTQHFEQAVFADGLSDASILSLRSIVAAQWRALTAELVPRLEQMIEEDARAGTGPGQRVRVGMFSYQVAAQPDASAPTPAPKKAASRTRRNRGEES